MCWAKQDIAQCPLLLGAKPENYANQCAGYQCLEPSAVLSYIGKLKGFYIWLVDQKAIPYTPVDAVFRRYKKRHSAWFHKRRMRPQRRDWNMEIAKTLIQGVPIQRGIMYALGAKCFLRLHEVVQLNVDPRFMNLEQGWMDIPSEWEYGGKRLGNSRIIIDDELRGLLIRYLDFREERIKRGADGKPLTDKLVVTTFGHAWDPDSFRSAIRLQLRKDLVRLGLMTGKETKREQRLNFHGLRALATTAARDNGAPDSALQVMRGDKAVGSIDRYDSFQARLPALYRVKHFLRHSHVFAKYPHLRQLSPEDVIFFAITEADRLNAESVKLGVEGMHGVVASGT